MTEHSSSQLKNTTTPTNDSTHAQDTTYQNPVSSISNFMVGGSSIADANPETILQLQSIVGNRAILGMIQRDGNGGNSAKEDESAPEVSAPPDPLSITLSSDDYSMCMEIYKQVKSWEKLKGMYVSSDTPDLMLMAKLWKFRRDYVVGLIKALRDTQYSDVLAKSVGSNDLTSDYDITLASPGSGNDVKAISDFNNNVKGQFGVQSGTLFDTNLYARDFARVEQSSEFKDADETYLEDSGIGALESLPQLEGSIEDVGALIKIRRYMSQAEWDTHTDEVVNGVEVNKQDAILKRYEEADAIYQIATANLLQRIQESLDETNDELDLSEDEEHNEEQNPLVTAQEQNAGQLKHLEDENSDLVLEKSNEVYLERMTVIREMQQKIASLKEELAAVGSENINQETLNNLIGDEFGALFNNMINNSKANELTKAIDAKNAQIKQLMSEAIFYAAEAYTSEGAILHVVAGIQGSKLTDNEKSGKNEQEQEQLLQQKMQQANDRLTLDNLLQSVNEQFGDFLKDYGHLAKKSPGTLYIKSSKYVDRMLDAIDILAKRDPTSFLQPANDAVKAAFSIGSLGALRVEIKKLYKARKDSTLWGPQREATSRGIMGDMGINSGRTYKAAIIKLGAQINIVIRNQLELETRAQEDSYFQNLDTEGMNKLD